MDASVELAAERWVADGVLPHPAGSARTNQNNARLTELRPYMDNGQRLFAVIMISNAGGDATGWEWWINAPASSIASHVNSDTMRVIAFAPDPLGGFDAILVASEGETWYWWYGIPGIPM